jgi:hypothetical protein
MVYIAKDIPLEILYSLLVFLQIVAFCTLPVSVMCVFEP